MMGSPLPRRSLLLLVALTFTCKAAQSNSEKPNVIFMLVDDLGYSDVSVTDPIMVTPNIMKLRQEGLFLNQSYTAPMCGPSRAGILSGRYPHTWGAQVPTNNGGSSTFFPKKKLLYMGDVMKKQGYATHALGKWHQGGCHPSLRPLGRGFDTFYGITCSGHPSHYNHTTKAGVYDWWDNNTQDFTANGTHSTILLTERMVRIINESNAQTPFFAYLAYLAVHKPFQIDEKKYFPYCKHIENYERRCHCAMVFLVDLGLGQIVEALKTKGIYNNTAIIFMSDNGGTAAVNSGSSDWPLRGRKGSLYEGGTNVFTVLKAPGLNVTNATWPWLIHGVDWSPTVLGIAGGEREKWMHGFNLWPDIKAFKKSSRKYVFYYFDDREDIFRRAYRSGKWKLIQGYPGSQLWYPPYNNGSDVVDPIKPDKSTQRKLGPNDYQLFNLEKDPYEKDDLALEKRWQQKLNNTISKMNKFLQRRRYKLQPYEKKYPNGQFFDPDTGKLTCFCQPPWADELPGCPRPSS